MKSIKTILLLVFAITLVVISLIFKEDLPSIIHFGLCIIGTFLCYLVVHIENKNS